MESRDDQRRGGGNPAPATTYIILSRSRAGYLGSYVLVTHQVNITALTGRIPASGEVFLLKIGRDDTISVVDEILIGPWR